jgi:diguanylate cyclase (GGDEF)-like protein
VDHNGPTKARLLAAPRGVLVYCLAIELVAVVLTLVLPGHLTNDADWTWFVMLLLIAVLQAELSARVEKMRRYLAADPHVNMTSVWLFAGALTLQPILAVLLTALIFLHLWLRVWRTVPGRPLYRVVCSAAMMTNAVLVVQPVLAALGLHDDPLGVASIVVAGLACNVVNWVQVLVGLKLEDPRRALLPPRAWNMVVLELATLCLGGTTAILLVVHPTLVPIMLLPVVVLPEGVLGRHLEKKQDRDHKTGLLTIAEWERRAATQLSAARQSNDVFSVLMIDIDHFKRVNDTYGHLAGDAALSAVAAEVQREVRVYDAVGRFGGEEFVVLLPGLDTGHSVAVAERVREAVMKLVVPVPADAAGTTIAGMSVSIGVAAYPAAGVELDRILSAADKSVYRAKQLGRNQVAASSRYQ